MPPLIKADADAVITASVIKRPEFKAAQFICLYMSLPEEVSTTKILENILASDSVVIVPCIIRNEMKLFRIKSAQQLMTGSYNIPEPMQSCPEVSVSSVSLFIVPGIAFDRYGYRLGWGKGYYDRLLVQTDVTKIGLAYAIQLVPRLPREEYDIPMDVVITEKQMLEFVRR